MGKPKNTPESFWRRVDRSGGAEACWPWTGYARPDGYGKYYFRNRKMYTHRISWMLTHRRDPGSLLVRHSCDNPPCVNPAHLRIGTQAQNLAEMTERGRRRTGARACGEASVASVLKEADVRAIRASTLSGKALALVFGVSNATIGHVRAKKTWKHVP